MKAQIPNLTAQQKAQILGDPHPQPDPDARAGASNPLAALHTLCADSPRRLISLWDMISFQAYKLYEALLRLERDEGYIEFCGNAREQEPQNVMFCKREITELKAFSAQLNLVETHGRVERFAGSLDLCEQGHKHFTIEEFFSEIRGISEAFVKELAQRQFAFIPADKACYFEQEQLFDRAVKDAASAELNREIKAAGNCFAADLNTAAVFHLMRVAEHGLHALAIHLGAWPATRTALEYSEWGEVLEAIRKELDARRKALPPGRGSAKEKEQRFYDGLLADLSYFLHDRNPVSHLRGHYEADEALPVFRKVGDFIKRLPPRVPLK